MFCPYCGSHNRDNAKFCSGCGRNFLASTRGLGSSGGPAINITLRPSVGIGVRSPQPQGFTQPQSPLTVEASNPGPLTEGLKTPAPNLGDKEAVTLRELPTSPISRGQLLEFLGKTPNDSIPSTTQSLTDSPSLPGLSASGVTAQLAGAAESAEPQVISEQPTVDDTLSREVTRPIAGKPVKPPDVTADLVPRKDVTASLAGAPPSVSVSLAPPDRTESLTPRDGTKPIAGQIEIGTPLTAGLVSKGEFTDRMVTPVNIALSPPATTDVLGDAPMSDPEKSPADYRTTPVDTPLGMPDPYENSGGAGVDTVQGAVPKTVQQRAPRPGMKSGSSLKSSGSRKKGASKPDVSPEPFFEPLPGRFAEKSPGSDSENEVVQLPVPGSDNAPKGAPQLLVKFLDSPEPSKMGTSPMKSEKSVTEPVSKRPPVSIPSVSEPPRPEPLPKSPRLDEGTFGQSKADISTTTVSGTNKPTAALFAVPKRDTLPFGAEPTNVGVPAWRMALMTAVVMVIIILGVVLVVIVYRNSQGRTTPAPGPSPSPGPVSPPTNTAVPSKATETLADMILVPGGEYVVGRDDGPAIDRYEKPRHVVALKPFYLDRHEVSNQQYKSFCEQTKRPFPSTWPDGQFPLGRENHPVTDVSYDDALSYAKWAGKRLPTEEEWEAAARGPDARLYPWGNEFDKSRLNGAEAKRREPVAVGSFPTGVGPFGHHDMAGNVWEWTATEAAAYPGNNLTVPNPTGVTIHVIRGGSYSEKATNCTTTFRNWVTVTTRHKALGFRCAKSAVP